MSNSTKRTPPQAYCAKCGTIFRSISAVNSQCSTLIAGKRCKGWPRSAVSVGDWKECESCKAEGGLRVPCPDCSSGYHLARKRV